MAWYRKAASYYLSQSRSRSMSPYDMASLGHSVVIGGSQILGVIDCWVAWLTNVACCIAKGEEWIERLVLCCVEEELDVIGAKHFWIGDLTITSQRLLRPCLKNGKKGPLVMQNIQINQVIHGKNDNVDHGSLDQLSFRCSDTPMNIFNKYKPGLKPQKDTCPN